MIIKGYIYLSALFTSGLAIHQTKKFRFPFIPRVIKFNKSKRRRP